MPPYGEVTLKSPVQSCHAHQLLVAVLKPSGCVPLGERMAYCALRLEAAVVLPKCPAALIASCASWSPVAWLGAAALLSYQTPASETPVGKPTCGAVAGHDVAPEETPSQYCVMTLDQPSLLVPRPLKSSCTTEAAPTESLVKVVSPLVLLPAAPHCVPQNTR